MALFIEIEETCQKFRNFFIYSIITCELEYSELFKIVYKFKITNAILIVDGRL